MGPHLTALTNGVNTVTYTEMCLVQKKEKDRISQGSLGQWHTWQSSDLCGGRDDS